MKMLRLTSILLLSAATVVQATPKLGIMETTFGNRASVESIELTKKAGLAGVQIHTGVPDENGMIPLSRPEVIEAFRAARKEHGVEIISLCAGEMNKHNSWEPEERAITLSIGKQSIQACKELDVPILLVPFFGKAAFGNDIEDPKHKAVISLLRELLPHAESANVTLGIETLSKKPAISHILETLNNPYLKSYYDTGNQLRAGEDIYQVIQDWGGDTICQMHLKPFKAQENENVFGRGQTDLPKLASVIHSSGYQGWLVFEPGWGKKTLGFPYAVKNIQGARMMLAEIPE